MRTSEARAAAERWVAREATATPGFAGAFLTGSAAWLAGDAELPSTSDVDLMVVTDLPEAPPKLGKFRYSGALLEVTYLAAEHIRTPEEVLASPHLAGSFRAADVNADVDTVLADPTGRLARLRAATAGEFARRTWVRRRCESAERRITDGLDRLDGLPPSEPFHDQVTAWLFPTGVTTHVLLAAGLRNPTVRRRYLAARWLLAEYGLMGFHEELLELLGCADPSRGRVEHHRAAMADAFDAAAAVARTRFFFSSDIAPEARPIAVDGSDALIADGHHREAVFWIAATYARCLAILTADAPAATLASHRPGFLTLLADLGVTSPSDLRARGAEVRAFLPRLNGVTERIIAATAGIIDT